MSSDRTESASAASVAKADAAPLVKQLLAVPGMTPDRISEELQGRVSRRTVYRWAKGECLPQNPAALAALADLVRQICPPSDEPTASALTERATVALTEPT